MRPARPLLEVFERLVSGDPAAEPAAVLAEGYADLSADLLATALVSYADTAPLEVAEHLAPFVQAHSGVVAGGAAGPPEVTVGLDLLVTAPSVPLEEPRVGDEEWPVAGEAPAFGEPAGGTAPEPAAELTGEGEMFSFGSGDLGSPPGSSGELGDDLGETGETGEADEVIAGADDLADWPWLAEGGAEEPVGAGAGDELILPAAAPEQPSVEPDADPPPSAGIA